MNKFIKILLLNALIFGQATISQAGYDMLQMKGWLEQAIAKINTNPNNYCRIQKDADKDVIACVIYETMPAGNATSEQEVTQISMNFDGSYQPKEPVLAQEVINGYKVNIWQEKNIIPVYPPKEIIVTTYVVNFNQNLQVVISCDGDHPCYAELLLNAMK